MKYQCGSCEEPMTFQGIEEPTEGSLWIAFGCSNCGHRIFLITNPQETQLVRSMGITLGETRDVQPLGLVRSTLRGIREELSPSMGAPAGKDEGLEEDLVWDEETEKRLEKVPPPIRPMARVAIERYAQQMGHKRITPQVVVEAREKLGM